jgi:hypothetical protein
MTASWLNADLLGDSLLRAPDADAGGSLMGLPAPSQFGCSLLGIPTLSQLGGSTTGLPPPSASLEGLFAAEHSWTIGFPRPGAAPPAELGPSSFRGLAGRLAARAQESGDGRQEQQAAGADQQRTAGGGLRDDAAARVSQDPQVRGACQVLLPTQLAGLSYLVLVTARIAV